MTSADSYSYFIDSRFGETDAMGVIYHSVYLLWFEAARFKFAHEILGLTPDVLAEANVSVPVFSCDCRYFEPVRFPERVEIRVRVELAEAARFAVHHEAVVPGIKGDRTVAAGKTEHVFIRPDGRLVPRYPSLIASRLVVAIREHPQLFDGADRFLSVYGIGDQTPNHLLHPMEG